MTEIITKNIPLRSDHSLFLFNVKERFNKEEGKIKVSIIWQSRVNLSIGSFLVAILPYAAFLGKKS